MQHLARFSATNVRQFSSQCGAKPPVSVVHTLKDGRTVTVRRLQVHEEPQLRSYVAVPKQILDALGGDELHDRAVRSHFFNAQTPGRDALAALLKDKVVGTTEIDPEPEDYEPSVDGGFVREQGLPPRKSVSRAWRWIPSSRAWAWVVRSSGRRWSPPPRPATKL